MATQTRNKFFIAFIALASLCIGVLMGCGTSPTSPEEGFYSYDDPTSAAAGGAKSNKGQTNKLVRDTSKVVGMQGDTVSVIIGGNGRKSGLFVPPGALRGVAEITMAVTILKPNRATGMAYEYEFGPAGLEFKFESTLFLDLPQRDGSPVMLWWYNPATKGWEFQGMSPVIDGRVSFVEIKHFSKYGITCRGNDS